MSIFQYNNRVVEEEVTNVTPNDESEVMIDSSKGNDVKIEFKGTLSEVYTQALNETYALESTDATSTITDESKSIVIYTVSDDELSNVQKVISDIREAIDVDSCMLVGLESVDGSQSELLKKYLEKELKVRVVVGVEGAMKGIEALKRVM